MSDYVKSNNLSATYAGNYYSSEFIASLFKGDILGCTFFSDFYFVLAGFHHEDWYGLVKPRF